jgi:adenylate cyclase
VIAEVTYRFGDFELRPSRRQLLANGTEATIGGRALDLLVTLIERRDRVVGKRELLERVWPNVAVEENSLTVAIAALRKLLSDDARSQRVIRTISGRGYQFIAPLAVIPTTGGLSTEGGAGVGPGEARLPPLPDRASIAVLPFANLSSDTEQQFFAEGIAEDITTSLARNRWLFVIARNSSFTYRQPPIDPTRVSRELGVRYILEGSVRRAETRVRVTAQLIDATTGAHLCAERYDCNLRDVFAAQDEITQQIIANIEPALRDAEQRRAVRTSPESLDAWLAYLRGVWHFSEHSAEHNIKSKPFFERAISLDGAFAPGYYGLARALLFDGVHYGTRPIADCAEAGWQLAHRAVTLDRLDPTAHSALAVSLLVCGDRNGALEAANQALSLNPNDAWAHGIAGAALVYSGRHNEGQTALERCIRLSPRDPLLWARFYNVALAHFYAGRLGEAEEMARRIIRQWPRDTHGPRVLAAVLAEGGRAHEAAETLQAAADLAPDFLDKYIRNRMPWVRPEDHERMTSALRKAGWTP